MKLITLLLLLSLSTMVFAEQLDSYKASNGKTYNVGSMIKLGRGSGQNGGFVYLTLGGIGLAGSGTAAQLDHTFTGSNCTIKRIKKTKDERVIFIVGAGGLSNYELSIEDAIATCEVVDCNKKEVVPVTIVNTSSKFDELKKLKDLLDSGAITEEEYKAEKEKLLAK